MNLKAGMRRQRASSDEARVKCKSL